MNPAAKLQTEEDEMYPPISPEEWADLEKEAGHPFLSAKQAHQFRLRKIHSEAIDRMLDRK
jgi:hypothetical protein